VNIYQRPNSLSSLDKLGNSISFSFTLKRDLPIFDFEKQSAQLITLYYVFDAQNDKSLKHSTQTTKEQYLWFD